ncbi:hypothetical protein ACWCQM_27915 [Streptomyces sp. NPDC002125]
MVSLEVYGHLHNQTISPDKLFREEMSALCGRWGFSLGDP